MKKNYLLCALFLSVVWFSNAQTKVIHQPPAIFANTHAIEINEVVLTDSATILDIVAFYTPRMWIRIVAESYLFANNKKYMIVRGEGIELDKEFWMPDSGKASFKLVFEPLPKDTEIFDFIESDCDKCFKVYGINLIRKSVEVPSLPAEFTAQQDSHSILDVRFQKGTATVSGKIIGYSAIPTMSAELFYINPITNIEAKKNVEVHSDGSFVSKIDVHSPATIFLKMGTMNVPIIVQPDKETKVWINLPEIYRAESKLLKNKKNYGKKYYYAGALGKLNNDLATESLRMTLYSSDFIAAIVEMDMDTYREYVMKKYDEAVRTNNSLSISEQAKMIANNALSFQVQHLLSMADSYLVQAYGQKYGLSYRDAAKAFPRTRKKENLDKYYRLIPYNEPSILVIPNISHSIRELSYASATTDPTKIILSFLTKSEEVAAEDRQLFEDFLKEESKGNTDNLKKNDLLSVAFGRYQTLINNFMKNNSGINYLSSIWKTDKAFIFDLIRTQKIAGRMENYDPLTEIQLKELENYPLPVRNVLLEQNKQLLAKIEENKKKTEYTILDVPNVDDEELFSSMLAPFKGKVVLVDVWATWCAPCRIANKEIVSVKAQLADKDIVYLYLTGETSPENTWRNMIADLHGYHYRVSDTQWNFLSEKLKAKGVPTYIIIDKEGNQMFHTIGYPGSSTIKEKLQEAVDK